MDKHRVFQLLKTKASSFGFNKDELMGVAEVISNNQALSDDSTDEEVNAQIDAVIPFLHVGQKQANRIAQAKPNPNDDTGNGGSKPSVTEPKQDDEPAWFKAYREKQEERIRAIEQKDTATQRDAKLQELLKDTGAYGKTILTSAKRMNFQSDEDFNEWLSEVETDLQAYRQELGNETLGKNAKPNASSGGSGNSQEVASEDEIKELAEHV